MVQLCRPRQWTKNVFVLAPLLFSESFTNFRSILNALIACVCFCLLSSAVYVLNDLVDAPADRSHPQKRDRPLASGRVSPATGVLVLALLLVLGGAAAALLPLLFQLLAALYIANSLLYCFLLKHRAILDVMMIAAGFVLRLLCGCASIGVTATSWIIVCGFSLALVLGFGKRRSEIAALGPETESRPVLVSYSAAKCDALLAISIAVCLLSYMLYTVAPETVERHRTSNLVYTVPIVAYGLFRYMFKTQEGKGGDGPSEILVRDWVFPALGALWIAAVAFILCFGR